MLPDKEYQYPSSQYMNQQLIQNEDQINKFQVPLSNQINYQTYQIGIPQQQMVYLQQNYLQENNGKINQQNSYHEVILKINQCQCVQKIINQNYHIVTPTTHQSQRLFCKQCKKSVDSQVEHKRGNFTIFWSTIFCITSCPLVCITCFAKQFKDTHHQCPECNQNFGKVNRKMLF